MAWRYAIAGAVVLALGVLIGILVAGGDDSEGSAAASTSTEASTSTSVVVTTTVADTTTLTTGVPQTVPTSPPPTTPEPTTPEPTTPEPTTPEPTTPTYVYPEWESLAQGALLVSLSDHTEVIWGDPQVRFDLVYHEGVPALQVSRPWWFVSLSDPGEPWRVCLDQPATPAANPIKLSVLELVEHWYGCVAGEDSIVIAVYLSYVQAEEVALYYSVIDLDA